MKEPEMRRIGRWIAEVLKNLEDESLGMRVRGEVEALTEQFPLYEDRRAPVASKAS
jgi:glycine hydroxymethyltransferase